MPGIQHRRCGARGWFRWPLVQLLHKWLLPKLTVLEPPKPQRIMRIHERNRETLQLTELKKHAMELELELELKTYSSCSSSGSCFLGTESATSKTQPHDCSHWVTNYNPKRTYKQASYSRLIIKKWRSAFDQQHHNFILAILSVLGDFDQ